MNQEDVVLLVVDALEREGIPYMLAGSFASNFHGIPRMTQDADVVIDAGEDAVLKLAHALQPSFYVSDDAAREAVRLRRMFNAIHLDTGFKVDLVVKKRRAFSVEEMQRRVRGAFASSEVTFASAEDTILTKLEWSELSGSHRQYDDAVGVLRVQRGRLDDAYLDRWAEALGVRELLAQARRDADGAT